MTDPSESGGSVPLPWVLLHGLFGDRDNLRSLGLHLERGREVLRLNLAGHGGAPAPAKMTLNTLADAVAFELESAGIARCHLIGHSLGGKVAMTLAGRDLARKRGQDDQLSPELESLIVLDIAPKQYPPHHRPLLDAMQSLDLAGITSRNDADAQLRTAVPHAGTRAFLLKSLARDGEHWRWQFALDQLSADYEELALAPAHIDPGDGSELPASLFVRGTASDYLVDDDVALVKHYFPQAEFRAVKAGHWLHAEKPAQIAELCEAFVARLA